MDIILNNSSQTPLYQQIYEQIVLQILNGTLCPDFCLPSIRNVSRDLNISVITVKNAYELLEKEGFIYTIAGKGCFVSALDKTAIKAKKHCIVLEKSQEILSFCKIFDIDINELIKALQNNSK